MYIMMFVFLVNLLFIMMTSKSFFEPQQRYFIIFLIAQTYLVMGIMVAVIYYMKGNSDNREKEVDFILKEIKKWVKKK